MILAVAGALSACGSATEDPATGSGALDPADWPSVLSAAEGQTVNWYMYGGDATLNGFVTGYVADRLADLGVTLNQVRIDETANAVNTVLGEKQAGKSDGGAVDAIWVNGENFATGVQADLWYCGWDRDLPNAKYVDFTSAAITTDFGVPVDGCEAAWQQANSALVYDSADLTAADVASVSSLFDWAKGNPGRLTYPAPPDFTGSMAVRTFFYDTAGGPDGFVGEFDDAAYAGPAGDLWTRLQELEPALWKGGETYPQSQEAVEKLYGDGQISAFFTYGPGAVGDKVAKGVFPSTTKEAVLDGGNIANTSFVAIPDNAAHRAAALVLADVLQDPVTQLKLYQLEGIYPAVDLAKVPADLKAQFAAVKVNPSVLPLAELVADAQPELSSDYISRIEKDWIANVLQK